MDSKVHQLLAVYLATWESSNIIELDPVLRCSTCVYRDVEALSQLLDIFTYIHHSCRAPHILCIQFGYQTMSWLFPHPCMIYIYIYIYRTGPCTAVIHVYIEIDSILIKITCIVKTNMLFTNSY